MSVRRRLGGWLYEWRAARRYRRGPGRPMGIYVRARGDSTVYLIRKGGEDSNS